MKKGILTAVLWTIFAVSSLEIIVYFAYIYKPFDRLSRKVSWDPKEIPSISEILTPQVIMGEDIVVDDTLKHLYLEKLNNYSEGLNRTLSNGSSFVKVSEANYVVSGTVTGVKAVKDKSGEKTSGYE